MAVDIKFEVDVKCYILWRLTWNKTKVVNKLSRVRSTDWKSALMCAKVDQKQLLFKASLAQLVQVLP